MRGWKTRTESLLDLKCLFQLNLMGNLLVLLDKVETFGNDGVVLILVLANLHQDFNHVLNTLANAALIEDGSEALVDSRVGFGRILGEEGTNFSHEANCNFNGIIGGSFQQENEDLKGDDFMCNSLVHEVSEECGGRMAYNLEDSQYSNASIHICYAPCRSS